MKLIVCLSFLILISFTFCSRLRNLQASVNNMTTPEAPTAPTAPLNMTNVTSTTISNNMTNNMTPSDNYTYLLMPPVLPQGLPEEMWKLIPPNFWVDMYGQPGKEFIMLNSTKGLISCDISGKLMVSKEFTPNTLWIPKPIGVNNENVLYLQNFYGGYLNVDLVTKVIDCFPRIPTATNIFKIVYSLAKDNEPNMMLMNEGFVTNLNNNFIASNLNMMSKSQLFTAPRNFSSFTNDDTNLWSNIFGIMMP